MSKPTHEDANLILRLYDLAKSYVEYLNRTGPDIAMAFRARVGG